MIASLTDFYLGKDEPVKSTLLALREIILNHDPQMTETQKYGMPCFCYGARIFCYLWTDKKSGEPYILMVDGKNLHHPKLVQGTRKRMKMLPISSKKTIPVKAIKNIFSQAIASTP
jgi:hypothetical protein